MPIDTGKDPDFTYRFDRQWTIDGHEVALGRLRPREGRGAKWSEAFLFCECDFDFTIEVRDGQKYKRMKGDSRSCPAKEKARESVTAESRAANGETWKKMGLEAAVLDIHRRVMKKEWFGQSTPGIIYVQEVAEILGEDAKKVWQACERLYSREKLDLNGAILSRHDRRFRLPKEMAGIIFRVVGDPLGYPNGDAGDIAVYERERRIQNKLGCRSGAKAFGNANWPRIDRAIVADHALDWLSAALTRAVGDAAYRERLRAIRRRDIEKDLVLLKEAHPEIRTDVFAEYVRELLALVWDRTELYEAYAKYAADQGRKPARSKKEIEDETVKEMAEEYGAWAKAFRDAKQR